MVSRSNRSQQLPQGASVIFDDLLQAEQKLQEDRDGEQNLDRISVFHWQASQA